VATVKSHLQRGLKLLRAKAGGALGEFVRHREPGSQKELRATGFATGLEGAEK
jgi:hypothetical protein